MLAVVWRYTSARQYFDLSNRQPPPGDEPYYYRVYDYIRYAGGPEWWPTIGKFVIVGAAVGLVIGALAWAVTQSRNRTLVQGLRIGSGLLMGVATGLSCAAVADRPKVFLEGINNSTTVMTIQQIDEATKGPVFIDVHMSTPAALAVSGATLGIAFTVVRHITPPRTRRWQTPQPPSGA